MLHIDYDITGLKGADYNPRQIDAGDLQTLGESIRTLGLVKPLIVRGELLVAGHQRTKALRAGGINRAPVFVLSKDTTKYDEIRFNQLHNGTDLDMGGEDAVIPGGFTRKGYHTVEKTGDITGNMRSPGATVRMEICDLIIRYGSWGGVVATFSGKIIHAAQYALAAKMLRAPLTVFAIPDSEEELYRSFLDRTYGVFSYEKLKRDTYIQTLAQMPRLRGGDKKQNKSTLYELHALPWLSANRAATYLDFGSGQGDYHRRMKADGFNAFELEFFRRKGSGRTLDVGATHAMVDKMICHLSERGQFDAVVCDSVLNSVDTVEAERSVMALINFFAKLGGRVFFSGRSTNEIEFNLRKTVEFQKSEYRQRVVFPDKDGITGFYREGHWFFQKYHSDDAVRALCAANGLKLLKFKSNKSAWQVEAVKERELDRDQVEAAIRFEFELPLVGDRRIGRSADMLACMERVLAKLRD